MSRHIRIPFLLDLYRVNSAHLILQEANNPDLDRDYIYRGPLINRIIIARVKASMHVKDTILKPTTATTGKTASFLGRKLAPPIRTKKHLFPSALSLTDDNRRQDQNKLETQLDSISPGTGNWEPQLIKEAASYIRGEKTRPVDEITQQMVGRLFVPNFVATSKTVRAGKRINLAIRSFNPFRWFYWIATLGLGRAQNQLWTAMKGNMSGVHAISIAVQNITQSMKNMRELFKDGYQTASIDEIRSRMMEAPENILRQSKTVSSAQIGPLKPGTLVIFSAHKAMKKTMDVRLGFMSASAAKCPAHFFVPELLDHIWKEAVNG